MPDSQLQKTFLEEFSVSLKAQVAQREGTKEATEKARKAAGVRSDQKGKTRERVRPSAGLIWKWKRGGFAA